MFINSQNESLKTRNVNTVGHIGFGYLRLFWQLETSAEVMELKFKSHQRMQVEFILNNVDVMTHDCLSSVALSLVVLSGCWHTHDNRWLAIIRTTAQHVAWDHVTIASPMLGRIYWANLYCKFPVYGILYTVLSLYY